MILKYERQSADEAFNDVGVPVAIPGQSEDALSVFFERGLTARLTLQGKLSAVSGYDRFSRSYRYSGRGPFELGLRGLLWRRKNGVVSLYVGGVLAGKGLNTFYGPPGGGQGDVQIRLLAGTSGSLFHRHAFEQVEVARLHRRKLPDEWRMDTTWGLDFTPAWTVMLQTYAGQALTRNGVQPLWVKAEGSLVRRVGPVRVQAGWREAVAGREAARDRGPVIALWKPF